MKKHRPPPLPAALAVAALAVATAVNQNGRDVMEKLANSSIQTNNVILIVCSDDCQGLISEEKNKAASWTYL